MNAYQLLQDVLDTPTDCGNYWHSQSSIGKLSGLTQSNISKQLYKLTINGVINVELREYDNGKTSKHYCLQTRLNAQETAQQSALAQLRSAVDVLANDLRLGKKLPIDEYQSLLIQIKKISAVIKHDVQEESIYDRQFTNLRNMFKNLTTEQVADFTSEVLACGSDRGAITDKYLTINADQA
jgi:hypothetical protein